MTPGADNAAAPTTFSRALAFVLRWEGGYVNDPRDPGGATNQGITQRALDAYCAARGIVPYDVARIEPPMVEAIYGADYWMPTGCGEIGWPACLVVFDAAVNCGVARAKRWREAAHGDVDAMLFERRNHYLGLANTKPALRAFLKGWLHRLDALAEEAKGHA